MPFKASCRLRTGMLCCLNTNLLSKRIAQRRCQSMFIHTSLFSRSCESHVIVFHGKKLSYVTSVCRVLRGSSLQASLQVSVKVSGISGMCYLNWCEVCSAQAFLRRPLPRTSA